MNGRRNHLFRSAARALAVSAVVAVVAAAMAAAGVETATDSLRTSASAPPPTPVLQPSHATASPTTTMSTVSPECRELTLAKAVGEEEGHAVVCDLPETGSGGVPAVALTVDCRSTRMWPAGGLVLLDPASRRSYVPDCPGGDDRLPDSEKTPKPSSERAVPPCGELVVEAGRGRSDGAQRCVLDSSTIITLSSRSLAKIRATTHYRLVNGAGREVEIRA
jgi:hypothetical protein